MLCFVSILILIGEFQKASHMKGIFFIAFTTMGCDPTYQNCSSQPLVGNNVHFSHQLPDTPAPATPSSSPQSESEYVDITPDLYGKTLVDLNIRTGPSTSSEILTNVQSGTILELICYSIGSPVFGDEDWIFVNYGETFLQDDNYGYASDYYIDCDGLRCKYHWDLPECNG
eukprot:TRINITY_DN8035_c0_g1_i1.p4 TRINITY_DN8035_c0_g1~~TRINITY_DN8035_c0_g1_i1.p4  ORF type:complete len:171 (-),score=7.64 TRINITY_DN8035_c0_g1_i1:1151-1663(-)